MTSSINSEAPISTNAALPDAVGDLLRLSGRMLQTAGIPEPKKEAAFLVAFGAGLPLATPFTDGALRLSSEQIQQIIGAVKRRAEGEPLAYVLGTAGFRTLELTVDSRVLIPRPETEGLVELVLSWAANRPGSLRLLDIGTGSGCIAISLAVEGNFKKITATDISDDALEVARANGELYPQAKGVDWRLGSFFEPVSQQDFDIVVSNPPYIDPVEYAGLAPGVRDFEPVRALRSGEQGMEHIRRIVEDARLHLRPDGLLALEIDSQRADSVRSVAEAGGYRKVEILSDVFGRQRFLMAERSR